MNAYQLLKQKQQKEFSQFPMFFAFSEKQFNEGMAKLGLSPTETDKIYSFGAGGFYKKSDSKKLRDMLDRFDEELISVINDKISGKKFCFDMFSYELANHEYGYTGDLQETIDAVGYTLDEINANKNLINGLARAVKEAW